MKETIGIFEAKTKLSELCMRVEECGKEYVITRRGRAIARLAPLESVDAARGTGLRQRMEALEAKLGPVGGDEEEFPDVWKWRHGTGRDPLKESAETGAES